MNNCTQKVLNCSLFLTSNDLNTENKKDNLKNIIINHILGNNIDLVPSTRTDISMVEVVKELEKISATNRTYCRDILNAICLGMELIQDSHISVINSNGKDRISEPVYTFNKDGMLESVTIRIHASMYNTLLQVSRYFDKRFMADVSKRTLKF